VPQSKFDNNGTRTCMGNAVQCADSLRRMPPPLTHPLVPALTFQRRACLDVPAMDGGRCVTRDCQSQRRHASMPPKEFDRLWFIWSSSAFVRSGRRAYSYLVEQLSTQIYNRRVLQPPASEYISAKPPLSSLFHAFVQQSGALAF
jgi:hypothetical protein